MKRALFIFMVFMVFTSICYAERNEWKDKNYDFKTIKRVAIGISFATTIQDQFAQQKTEEIMAQIEQKKRFNVVFIPVKDLFDQIIHDYNLENVDEKTRREIVLSKSPEYADALLVIKVNELGWFKQYVPPRSFSYTSWETSTVQIGGSSGTITSPVQRTINRSGDYEEFPVASAEFTLYSMSAGKVVWGYSELRNEQGGILFSKKNKPEDNLEDIFNNAVKKIPIPKP